MISVVIILISLVPMIGTLVSLRFMPDTIPMHYNIYGDIDRWGSKYEALLFPGVILILALVWILSIRKYKNKMADSSDEKSSADARTNAKVLGIIGVAMSVILSVMDGFLLYGSYTESISGATKQTPLTAKMIFIMLGIVFIILGNFLTKTRSNGVIGVRMTWSRYNDNTWRKTNRFAAFASIFAGFLIIILALVLKNYFVMAVSTLGLALLTVVATIIYARKVYVHEVKKS